MYILPQFFVVEETSLNWTIVIRFWNS